MRTLCSHGERSLEPCAISSLWEGSLLRTALWYPRKTKPGRARNISASSGPVRESGGESQAMIGIKFLQLEGWGHQERFKMIKKKKQSGISCTKINFHKIHTHHKITHWVREEWTVPPPPISVCYLWGFGQVGSGDWPKKLKTPSFTLFAAEKKTNLHTAVNSPSPLGPGMTPWAHSPGSRRTHMPCTGTMRFIATMEKASTQMHSQKLSQSHLIPSPRAWTFLKLRKYLFWGSRSIWPYSRHNSL